jgi:hypothetical protein
MNPKNLKANEVLELLEMPQDSLILIKDEKGLEVFKEVVKKQRKVLAKKYHPDKFPSQNIMHEVNALCDFLLKLRIIYQPRPQVIRVHSSYSYTTTGTTNSTSYY